MSWVWSWAWAWSWRGRMIGWMSVEAGERPCPLSTLVALSITPAHSTTYGSPAARRPPPRISRRSGGGILSGFAFFFFSPFWVLVRLAHSWFCITPSFSVLLSLSSLLLMNGTRARSNLNRHGIHSSHPTTSLIRIRILAHLRVPRNRMYGRPHCSHEDPAFFS